MSSSSSKTLFAVAAISAIGALFRLWNLPLLPPSPAALTLETRLLAAAGGVALLPALFLLGRSLLRSRGLGLLASLVGAVSFWHILFSRTDPGIAWMTALIAWGTWLIWDGAHHRVGHRVMELAGAGFLGIALYAHPLALLFIAALFVVLRGAPDHHRRWSDILILASVVALLAVPLLAPLIQHPRAAVDNITRATVFSLDDPLASIERNAAATAGMFHWSGDCRWRHNFARPALLSGRACAPQLIWPIGLFFAAGFLTSLARLRRSSGASAAGHKLLFVWFVAMLLPGVIGSAVAPEARLTLGAAPAVYLYSALGVRWALNRFGSPRRWWIAAFVIVFAAIGVSQWHRTFTAWGEAPETQRAFERVADPIRN